VLEEERETEREEAAELEVGDTLPVPGEQVLVPFSDTLIIYRIVVIPQGSVAEPVCLSRIRIFSILNPVSEFFPSRIRIKEFKYRKRG
jgi:hypothetical protein